MDILGRIETKYGHLPLGNKSLLLCTHATDATCGFIKTLTELGTSVFYVPVAYSRNKHVMANIRSIPGITVVEKMQSIQKIISKIDIIIEDGFRISREIYKSSKKTRLKKGLYCMEQTTSGIHESKNMAKRSSLMYPIINIAESRLKLAIENSLSTPEAILSSFAEKRSFVFSQKKILVLGYGHIGSGIARLCEAHGSHVTVADSDPVKRIVATSHGFCSRGIDEMGDIIQDQDLIISCTYNRDGSCLDVEKFLLMKDGAVIINAGSGHGEISQEVLNVGTFEKNRAKVRVSKKGDDVICLFRKMGMKKTVEILCSAHPINLRHGVGTPKESLDFVFSLMAVAAIKIRPNRLSHQIHTIDQSIEEEVAGIWESRPYDIKPQLIRHEELYAESRAWGKLSRFVSDKDNLRQFSTVRASFKPNSSTDGHYHLTSEEAYFIEKGTADIVTWDPENPDDKTTFAVKPGDYLMIPKGRAHRVFVTSAINFDCLVVASPPFSFWDQFFPENHPIELVA